MKKDYRLCTERHNGINYYSVREVLFDDDHSIADVSEQPVHVCVDDFVIPNKNGLTDDQTREAILYLLNSEVDRIKHAIDQPILDINDYLKDEYEDF